MTDPAQTAVENAFRLEAKKDRLAQRQSGDWTITFTVQASDMPNGLLVAAMGTRFVLAACEIADDEQPVVQPEAAQATPEGGYVPPPIDEYDSMGNRLSEDRIITERLAQKAVEEEAAQTTPADDASEVRRALGDQLEADQPAERRQMTPANVAGMLTGQVVFQTFLQEQFPSVWARHVQGHDGAPRPLKEAADKALKELTGVESKTQYDRPGTESADRWSKMHAHYDAWRGIGT